MSRNKKIIISITGIVIVVITLLGLTYAYFVTQIQGNENDKSIEVSTANLRLIYADGNGTVTANNITPGTITEPKIFTVKNNGNGTVGNYKVYLENVINTFTNTSDVVINMTCTSDVENKTCNGLTNFVFPTTNDLLTSNSINVGETQTYSLTVTYKETGTDQSVDMEKTFSGKIQIYDARNIVDISGTVSDASDDDYVEFHSEPKVSQINNEKEYKITAVEPGEHTFYIKSSNGSIKGSKTININRSNMVNHTDTNIDITEDTSEIKMDVTTIDTDLKIRINNIILNPYSYNSNLLSFNIINNAQLNKNRTTYEPTSITMPGSDINAVYSYSPTYYESDLDTVQNTVDKTQQEYYWTYADSFNFDKATGKFNLVNPKTCKYSECYANLIGKYVVSFTVDYNSSSKDILQKSSDLNYIYKISSAPAPSSTGGIYVTYKGIYNIPDSAERTISKAEDDYGDSYYFRGDVKDNYVNFNKMCWRIVRIEGDGSVKLILEDLNSTCNSDDFTGNYRYTTAVFGYQKNILTDNTNIIENDFLNYSNGLYDNLKKFQDSKMSGVLDKLKNDEWCYDNTSYSDENATTKVTDLQSYYQNKTPFYYAAYKRIIIDKKPELKCMGTKLTKYKDGSSMFVGTITGDEITFAGAKYATLNYNYYLMNKYNKNRNSIWTMTPIQFVPKTSGDSYVLSFTSSPEGYIYHGAVSYVLPIRPLISLKSNIEISSGDGTQTNPYVIK